MGHCGSSHPFSFCIVGTSLSVTSFPISHWFQWGAVSLTQGHRKSGCKSGSCRKQFLSVHILPFIGPFHQNQLSNGAVLAFLVPQCLMPSVLLHSAATHSQLHLSLSEPLLISLLFLRSSWCAVHTVGNEWVEKSTQMKARLGRGSLVDWEGLHLTLLCLILFPVEKSVSSLTDDGYIPRRFDSQGRN